MDFGHKVDPTANIRAILDEYPFSVGIFREFLQNSDDALASKQIFVLDRRYHPTVSLFDPKLAGTQGPALLAYNDARVTEADWEGLQTVRLSTKRTDTSKIGKFGIGLQSCCHITDNLEVLSGSTLAIFDPQHEIFPASGGQKIDLAQHASTCADQLSAFDAILEGPHQDFTGTVFRLPLRTNPQSRISTNIVKPDTIRSLLDDFVTEEMDIELLFLRSIHSIEVYEVADNGNKSLIAETQVVRDAPIPQTVGDEIHSTYKCTVTTKFGGKTVERHWRVIQSTFPNKLLVEHLGTVEDTLSGHKLLPETKVAVPLSLVSEEYTSGRLFTFLPLPLPTGFPFHLHASFALTQSRQHLRNDGEVGVQGPDSVLVKWNALLFKEMLPKALAVLLPTLVKNDGLVNIFRAWPPSKPIENSNWQHFAADLLSVISSGGFEVWPVALSNRSASHQFSDLTSVLVTSLGEGNAIVHALGKGGLRICPVPPHIADLLRALDKNEYTLLTPQSAHQYLLESTFQLALLDKMEISIVLEYLLSSQDLTCIIGLPVILLPDGKYVALASAASSPQHTLMDPADFEVFGRFEETPILMNHLPSHIAQLLRTQGPRTLNVCLLTPERVISYLQAFSAGLGNGQDPSNVAWLTTFWHWMRGCSLRDDLIRLLKSHQTLRLVPTQHGLKPIGKSVFRAIGMHPRLLSALELLQIPFVRLGFSELAERAMGDCVSIQAAEDLHALLEHAEVPTRLDVSVSNTILQHIVWCGPASCNKHGPLNASQRGTLRRLPIFPLLKPSVPHATESTGSIPESTVVEGVVDMRILPDISGISYLDGARVDLSRFLEYLEPHHHPLRAEEVLQMALDHFIRQPKGIQCAVVEYMVQNSDSLPKRLFAALQATPFVQALDGSVRSPKDLVDPGSTVASLFAGSRDCLPTVSLVEDRQLINHLRALGLMQDKLSKVMIEERIQYVATNDASPVATQLLYLLSSTRYNCSSLQIANVAWLPTKQGLKRRDQCLDSTSHPRELFDHVLEDIVIPSSLRTCLGWDNPVPLPILIDQFGRTLEMSDPDSKFERLMVIVKELGTRALSDSTINTLKKTVTARSWIPTSSGMLVATSRGMLTPLPTRVPGFHAVSTLLRQRARGLLLRMGCTDSPSKSALLLELLSLPRRFMSTTSVVDASIPILRSLSTNNLSDDDLGKIIVPDTTGDLRPIDRVRYNDVGDRGYLVEEGTFSILHRNIDRELATKLGVRFLGLESLVLQNLAVNDMEEKLATRIQNVLKQYTELQTLPEFLANASDAGGTEFKILVDEKEAPSSQLLSPSLSIFQTCPSLIMFNNGTFTQKDFEGMCNIGVGGKKGSSRSIGQFGLGALSMFHFTEMAMVVSGDRVLFIDPTKTRLPFEPFENKAVMLLPLHQIARLYPDHLASIDGLFGFHAGSTSFYHGTLFRLPLRNMSHVTATSILNSQSIKQASHLREQIVGPYRHEAKMSFLFTKLDVITASYRDRSGKIEEIWSLTAHRNELPYSEGYYRSHRVIIESRHGAKHKSVNWTVSTAELPLSDAEGPLGSDFSSAVEKHRLRSPILIGLAACTNVLRGEKHNLFTTLPLPMATRLPVHLTASFILAPDRRNIRFDNYMNVETRYNRWLLADMMPPLYLFLMEVLLYTEHKNDHWWPGGSDQTAGASGIDNVLVKSLYSGSHLGTTSRRVFTSSYLPDHFLTPNEAIVSVNEPSAVAKAFKTFKSPGIVRLPPGIYGMCSAPGLFKEVDPQTFRTELLRNVDTYQHAFDQEIWTASHLKVWVDYLLSDTTEHLLGLPLLPLADGTWETFSLSSPSWTKGMHYAWKDASTTDPLFPADRLIHPRYLSSIRGALDKALNVAEITPEGFSHLVEECVPKTPLWDAPPDSGVWVQRFWARYPKMGIGKEHISMFPLVPCRRQGHPGQHISIAHCLGNSVIILESRLRSDMEGWLDTCLNQLGATVVRRIDLPSALRDILLVSTEPLFYSILNLLSAEPLIPRLARFDTATMKKFAKWARDELSLRASSPTFPPHLRNVAHALPIWRLHKAPPSIHWHPHSYSSASEARMLPAGVELDLALKYINLPFTTHSGTLNALGAQQMSFAEFRDHLQLPRLLHSTDVRVYRHLLELLIDKNCGPVRVPNGNSVLVSSADLYAHDRLFEAAFPPTSFPLNLFQDLENDLSPHPFGLKRERDLNLAMFKACATAIHDDVTGNNRVTRAAVVYRVYSEDLPLRIQASASHAWHELDALSFIPRDPIRQRSMSLTDDSVYVVPLPDVVSPNQILREEFRAIAWTRRAVFTAPPNQRVLLANPTLGIPSVLEVVEHLRTLSLRVAQDHSRDERVLSDLFDTYSWLNERTDEAGRALIDFHDEKLFLNVDDPREGGWGGSWCSSDQLFFNISTDTGSVRFVRGFLLPFRHLLESAGAEIIVDPQSLPMKLSTPDTKLTAMLLQFDKMREAGNLTDVDLIPEHDPDDVFHAHRCVLASASEYFWDLFCGPFAEAGPATINDPVAVPVENGTGTAIELVLEYIYKAAIPDIPSHKVLLEVMELSFYWRLEELSEAVQNKVVQTIGLETHEEIFERATKVDATIILDSYGKWESSNRAAILRLKTAA